MTYLEYFELHEQLVAQKATTNNRTDPAYIEYTLLNFQRVKRWQKSSESHRRSAAMA